MAVTSLTAAVTKAIATLTNAAVTDLIGTGTSARIYADRFPQNATLPAVMVEVDEDEPLGDLSESGRLVRSDVNVVCRSLNRATTDSLVHALRTNGGAALGGLPDYTDSDLDLVVWEDVVYATVPKGAGSQEFFRDANITLTVWWRYEAA